MSDIVRDYNETVSIHNNSNGVYPHNDKYKYRTRMVRINLDEECKKDLATNNGFEISEPRGLKKDLKDPNGIYSTKFGQTLDDINPFADRYKCECGELTSRVHHGIVCPKCGTKVKFIDDNFSYFGWCILNDDYFIIHPNLYKSISFFIGEKNFDNIIRPIEEKDQNGQTIINMEKPKNEPYYGLGIMGFYEKFDEVMDYYLRRNYSKKNYYDDIMSQRELIFAHSIPVFTSLLRPYKQDGNDFHYNDMNNQYTMISSLTYRLNKNNLKLYRKSKTKKELHFDLQDQYNKVYAEIENILSSKKGTIRTAIGGKCNFTSRNVIVPDPTLRVDQVTLSYMSLVELLKQKIINIYTKSYNVNYNEAYQVWQRAIIQEDYKIKNIILSIIHSNPEGIPILINRNPTIAYGSIMQMFVVGITETYTMGLPLQILKALCADFDGDVLNIFYIIDQEFFEACREVFNPREAMFISRNDGLMDNNFNHSRDTIINTNTFVNLSRNNYSDEQRRKIHMAMSMAGV